MLTIASSSESGCDPYDSEYGRMPNGEVLEADADRDLVVDDVVEDAGQYAPEDDLQRLHGVISGDRWSGIRCWTRRLREPAQ
jgi:hypothetical protein